MTANCDTNPVIAKKRSNFIVAAAVLVLMLPLIVAEISVRIFSPAGYFTPETLKKKTISYVPSPYSRSAFEAREQTGTNSLNVMMRINPKGYRGPDFQVPKPHGIIRVIFYGGSSAFDIGAAEGKDWPRQVETLLRARGFSNVEVINAAVPGYASFDCFGSFFAEGHLFEPDIVILSTGWNDIKFFYSSLSLLRSVKPYREDATPLMNYQNPLDQFLCEISQFYVRLRYRYFCWKNNIGLEGTKPSIEKVSEPTPNSLRQYRLSLEMFVTLAQAVNATPVLMTEPTLLSSANSGTEKSKIHYDYQPLKPESVLPAYEKTREMMREVATRKGAVLWEASDALSGKNDFFLDHVHVSPRGSEAVAKWVAGELEKLLKNQSQKNALPRNEVSVAG